MTIEQKPPFPPFSVEEAVAKVRKAEDAWNTKQPEQIAQAYSVDSTWRNRNEFIHGREQIIAFLRRKWVRELDYRLIKELWACNGSRIAVRFVYEWHDDNQQWYRSYGNENWEFNDAGLMHTRHASINDLPIKSTERKLLWEEGIRPADYPSVSDFGF